MYESIDDPYCYEGTRVLKNKLDLREQADLDAFEAEITHQRSQEPLPTGNLDHAHYRAIHKHFFQDIFDWAGERRTVRISKGGNMFCYPENIEKEATQLFAGLANDDFLRGLSSQEFAKRAAHLLADINAVHPFREGNGRTQLSFLTLLADEAGHPLDLERMDPDTMMEAMIASFVGTEKPLEAAIAALVVAP